jgi:hypothetical protein
MNNHENFLIIAEYQSSIAVCDSYVILLLQCGLSASEMADRIQKVNYYIIQKNELIIKS